MKKILLASSLIVMSSTVVFGQEVPVQHTDLSTHTLSVATADASVFTPGNTTIAAILEARITSGKYDKAIRDEFGEAGVKIVRRAYAEKLFQPLWTDAGASSLKSSVDDLFAHGIVANEILKNDVDRLAKKRFSSRSAKKQAKADVKLTLAWMRTAKALSGGLSDDGGVDLDAETAATRFNLTDALVKSSKGWAENELFSLTPQNAQYLGLRNQLSRYRQIKMQGGWLAIPDGDAIEVGDSDPRIPALKTRLGIEGFYSPLQQRPIFAPITNELSGFDSGEGANDKVELFTQELAEAVIRFQKKHGLEADGILGANTILALNESVDSKIDRIADSMHRWRYQGDLGTRYIWANIPSFTAEGWNNGRREIKMRSIVGKPRNATPVFSDRVEYMVANPKWYVPVSITRRQKLPKLRRDPAYAEKFGYEIFDRKTGEKVDAFNVDWSEASAARKYRFVQAPGDGNALGEMKIIFPNQYSVYLHGTPGKHLFDRAQRAFSSGCVRLEDPVAMATWIASGDEDVTRAEIHEAIEIEENERFTLDEKLPVHITYYTVTINDDGTANFLRDIYKRDDGISTVKKYAQLYEKPQSEEIRGPISPTHKIK